MRLSLFLTCTVALLGLGCATHHVAQAPVVVTGTVRESPPNDYQRVGFLSPGTEPTTLSRPGALRAFVTATALYVPPLKVRNYPAYSGLVDNEKNMLVAMRCQPPHPEKVDALLATWPNVFLAIQHDVPLDPSACSAHPSDTATQMACYARAFSDPPMTAAPASLAETFNYAGKLFSPDNKPLAQWLQSNYGIYAAFSGTATRSKIHTRSTPSP